MQVTLDKSVKYNDLLHLWNVFPFPLSEESNRDITIWSVTDG